LAQALRIRRVLEFGSGYHSTRVFLNRSAFPELVSLHSIESDAEWIPKVREATHRESRLLLKYVPEPIESVLDDLALESYDLIFVDSSAESSRRVATISAVAERCPSLVLVVIHDFENVMYRKAAKKFQRRFEFAAFNPCTAVVWYGGRKSHRALKEIRKIIFRHANEFALNDVEAWCAAFQKEMKQGLARESERPNPTPSGT